MSRRRSRATASSKATPETASARGLRRWPKANFGSIEADGLRRALCSLTAIQPASTEAPEARESRDGLTAQISQALAQDAFQLFSNALIAEAGVDDQRRGDQRRPRPGPVGQRWHWSRLSRRSSAVGREGRNQVVWARLAADLDTPVSLMLKLTEARKDSFMLECVTGGEVRGRYSIVGMKPDLIWQCHGDDRAASTARRASTRRPSARSRATRSTRCAR